MANVKDFFIPTNSVEYISNADYKIAEIVKHVISAVPRTSCNSFYIIDYFKRNFLYVSSNPLFLCGHTVDYVLKRGYNFYQEHISQEEFDMLVEINKVCFEWFDSQPIESRLKFTSSYDFHLVDDQNKKMINHKLTPILLTKSGRIWLALCVVSLSARREVGNVEIYKFGSQIYWSYSFENQQWNECKRVDLSDLERVVLALLSQGFNTSEIARQICKSVDAVKACKRRLFCKFNARNSRETLTFATIHNLL